MPDWDVDQSVSTKNFRRGKYQCLTFAKWLLFQRCSNHQREGWTCHGKPLTWPQKRHVSSHQAIILTIKDFTMWITLTPYRAPFKRASQPPRKANDAGMNGRRKKHLDLQVAEGAEKRSDAVSNNSMREVHGNSMGIPWEFLHIFKMVPWCSMDQSKNWVPNQFRGIQIQASRVFRPKKSSLNRVWKHNLEWNAGRDVP